MQVEVKVQVPLVDAFNSSGADSGVQELEIRSYHPSNASPRVQLLCPDGSTLIVDSALLIAGIQHASVML